MMATLLDLLIVLKIWMQRRSGYVCHFHDLICSMCITGCIRKIYICCFAKPLYFHFLFSERAGSVLPTFEN